MRKPRGFAAMTPAKRRAISRKGGAASAASPKHYRWTREQAKAAAVRRAVSMELGR